jgi:hypothetical protein
LLRHSSLEDVSQVIGTSSWHVSAPRYSTKTGIVRVCVLCIYFVSPLPLCSCLLTIVLYISSSPLSL